MKFCNKCGKVLPVSEFYKNKTRKDGLRHQCKSCTVERQKIRQAEYAEANANRETDLSGTKRCCDCGKILPRSEFYKNKTRKDGLRHQCKSCEAERKKIRQAEYAEANANRETDLSGTKRCCDCGKILPRSEFSKCKTAKDGLYWRCKSCDKAYFQTPAGKAVMKHHSHKRRALKLGSVAELTQSEKLLVLAIEAECAELNAEMTAAGFDHGVDINKPIRVFWHVDHIIPLTRGGLHHPDNLQLLPAKINIRKRDKII